MTDREIKALQIAAKSELTRKGNTWTVPSQTGHGEYKVSHDLFSARSHAPITKFVKRLASTFMPFST